ncbi:MULTISPECIES: DUF2474 domain-containing protein [Enterobacterales]|nr:MULTISPECIES: DUF2474 domain-containing protein [Enterobacterales]RSV87616.1 DUF2474 domain-containing protein [Klebsiella aerogenes]
MKSRSDSKSTLLSRVLWMVLIWGGSVLTLGLIASIFKMLMYSAGMRTP